MPLVLYVASLNSGDGKTVLSASLARRWQQAGKRIDYVRPVSVPESSGPDSDVDQGFLFARRALGLPTPEEGLAPVMVSAEPPDGSTLAEVQTRVRAVYEEASRETDIVLMEAAGGVRAPGPTREVSKAVAEVLQARVLLVVRYSRQLDAGDVVAAAEVFGESLVGVVINGVPQVSMRIAAGSFAPSLEEAGLRVLGLVPEARFMFGIGVQDLVDRLNGRYVLEGESDGKLVENIMVGANLLDAAGYPAGPEYFGRRDKKAVVAKGDRPDFQWSALDTATECLILTGNHQPISYVIEKAREKKVPVAVVERDTLDTMAALEEILAAPRFDLSAKLERFQALVEESLDLDSLDEALKG